MKKIVFSLISILAILVSVTGCNTSKENEEIIKSNTESNLSNTEQTIENNEETVENKENLYNFEFLIDKNNIKTFYYVSAPYFDVNLAASCFAGEPMTGAYAIIGGEPVEGLAVPGEKVENVFPTYFDVAKNALNFTRESVFEQLDFTVDNKELFNINGYEMCKFTGKHTCYSNHEEKMLTMHYVAYATQVKENGGWAFWMFIDESDDMSNMKVLEEYALSMANTFYEKNFMDW